MADPIPFEGRIAHAEYIVTNFSIIPIASQIGGAFRIFLGVIQTVGGLLLTIISSPARLTDEGKKFNNRAFSHLVNGLGNIVCGAVEITWVGGVISYVIKANKMNKVPDDNDGNYTFTGNEYNLIGYQILEDNPIGYCYKNSDGDWEIEPGDYDGEALMPSISHPWIAV